MLHRSNIHNKNENQPNITLTILITVVSGKKALSNCLKALYFQVDFDDTEIIVPFDKWSESVGELKREFPEVNFHYIEDLGLAASDKITSHQHRLYDRRRSVGLNLSSGKIIAMTEDHAIPAKDWCQQILKLHEQPFGVIGGAVENRIDNPLNWAWYYCDFGRYGKPLADIEPEYVSDINVAYKRDAIMSVRNLWQETYSETTVHWAMRSQGEKFLLDERMVVYQKRPKIKLSKAFRERIDWGRIFAETRAKKMAFSKRLIYSAGATLLPPLLLFRLFKHMKRQKRTFQQIAKTLPVALILLTGWSLGEMFGYLRREPKVRHIGSATPNFKVQ